MWTAPTDRAVPDEAQAKTLRSAILELAHARDLDSAVVALALADTLATIAVVLDRRDAARTLNDRLGPFCQRVEETYARMIGAAAVEQTGGR